jgi:hypothetical protein
LTSTWNSMTKSWPSPPSGWTIACSASCPRKEVGPTRRHDTRKIVGSRDSLAARVADLRSVRQRMPPEVPLETARHSGCRRTSVDAAGATGSEPQNATLRAVPFISITR